MEDIRTAVKKVVDQDIRLLAVGVTNDIDKDTLKELSSPPHTVFMQCKSIKIQYNAFTGVAKFAIYYNYYILILTLVENWGWRGANCILTL